jgi:hypothetical protein
VHDFAKTKIKVLNELRFEYGWGTTGTPTQVSGADFHTLAQQPGGNLPRDSNGATGA